MKMRTIGSLLIALFLTLTVTGCSQLAEQAIQKSTGASVNASGGQVTVTGPNGQKATVSGEQNQLPADLPASVPTYKATVKTSATVTTDKGTNYTFSMETPDDVATVASWYKNQLVAKGWTMKTVASVAKAAVLSAKMGSSTIEVTIGKVSGGTQTAIVTIAIMGK
jgi:hypothetical protein